MKKNIFNYGADLVLEDGREVSLEKQDWILLKKQDAGPGQIQKLRKIKR